MQPSPTFAACASRSRNCVIYFVTTSNGRDGAGRFAPGNRLAKGNPHARRAQELRAALFEAVTPEDLREVVLRMVQDAKDGDHQARKELFDRTLGKPVEADLIERISELEQLLVERTQQ